MRVYNVKAVLQKHGQETQELVEEILILADGDDKREFVQMIYGCFYDIISVDFEEAKAVLISKNYIEQQAREMIKFN